jgi:predicted CXXCH cytochrome family protein
MQSAISVLFLAVTLQVLAAGGGIESSPHDFTFTTDQVHVGCAACHHPHTPTGVPARWQLGPERTRPFLLYQTRAGLPDRSTLICLSCHDGVVATEIPVGTGATVVSQIGRSHGVSGERLSVSFGSHPVGVPYAERERKFVPKATVEAGGIRLPGGRVECISCHDPHGTSGIKHLLVKSDRRSALCLSCHRL